MTVSRHFLLCADEERASAGGQGTDEANRRTRSSRRAASPRYGCSGACCREGDTPEGSAPGTPTLPLLGGCRAGSPCGGVASGELSGSDAGVNCPPRRRASAWAHAAETALAESAIPNLRGCRGF